MKGYLKFAAFALVGLVMASLGAPAQAANIVILTHDTGVDMDALITATAALLGAALIVVLAYAFGFRLVMAVWNKSRVFFAAR